VLFVALPTYDFAVAWISSVTEVLGALSYLVTVALYASHVKNRPAGWRYGGAVSAFLLALLSKESAITIPVVLLGILVVLDRPASIRAGLHRGRELVPFVALAAGYFAFLYFEEYQSGAEAGLYSFGRHAAGNFWDYLKWLTLPLPDDRASWVGHARPITAGAFLALGGAAVVLRSRVLAFGFLWTMIALLPYSFFETGIEYRYTYLAAIPFSMFTAVLVETFCVAIGRAVGIRVATILGGIALVAFTVFLAGQARERQDWIGHQASLYSELFEQAPFLCNELPRGSSVFILRSPIFDYYGVSTRMALNIHYEDVQVDLVEEVPAFAAFTQEKCVLEYGVVIHQYARVK
jgi:hypothetical protein